MIIPSFTDSLESYDMVSRFDGRHTLANGFDNTGTLMTQDDWECAFRIFPR